VLGWLGFRPGTRTSGRVVNREKVAQDRRHPIEDEEPRDIPINCPSSVDLRTTADWLASHFPAAAGLDLVRLKDYTAAHELVGAHDVISAIRTLADDLDATQADEDAAKAVIE
jgi:rhodanese-related sulfurtransferase